MLNPLVVFALALLTVLPVAAQTIGDSQDTIETLLGSPQMSRQSGNSAIWIYKNGVKVRFTNGHVTEIEGMSANTAASPAAASKSHTTVSPARNLERESQTSAVVIEAPPAKAPASSDSSSQHDDDDTSDETSPGILTSIVFILGGIIACVCNVLLLITAFKEHVFWGLAYLFIPFASLVFVLTHWAEAKKPFLGALAGTLVMAVGISLGYV